MLIKIRFTIFLVAYSLIILIIILCIVEKTSWLCIDSAYIFSTCGIFTMDKTNWWSYWILSTFFLILSISLFILWLFMNICMMYIDRNIIFVIIWICSNPLFSIFVILIVLCILIWIVIIVIIKIFTWIIFFILYLLLILMLILNIFIFINHLICYYTTCTFYSII